MISFIIYNKNQKKVHNSLLEGKYHAYITDVYTEENSETNFGITNVTTINYDVLSNDKIYKVKQILYYNPSENSEFQKRISEFMSVFNLSDLIEDSDLVNKFVDIELSVKESKNGREYNKVEHILPYTGNESDWDVAKGITPPSTKPLPKSAAADLLFGDEEDDEEGGEA